MCKRAARVLVPCVAVIVLGLPPAAAPAAQTLTYATVHGSVSEGPLMDALNLVAQGAGFYRDEDLTVTYVYGKDAADVARICSSGEADFCGIGIERVFSGYDTNVPLTMFLANESRYTYVIVVPADSNIAALADLNGKDVGVHQLGPPGLPFGGQIAVAAMLGSAGLRPADYDVVEIGYYQAAMDALLSGKVAAAGYPRYEVLPFQANGVKLRLFESEALAPSGGFDAGPAALRTKGDALRRFSRAIVKSALLIRLNPRAAARAMLQAQGAPFTDADLALLTSELTLWEDDLPAADPASKRIGAFPLDAEARYAALLAQFGQTKEVVPVAATITNQFIDFANDFDRAAFAARAKAMR
jgi:ABC-type nitrate/sulfonate/bicarbonate transport system substrate-binding protein